MVSAFNYLHSLVFCGIWCQDVFYELSSYSLVYGLKLFTAWKTHPHIHLDTQPKTCSQGSFVTRVHRAQLNLLRGSVSILTYGTSLPRMDHLSSPQKRRNELALSSMTVNGSLKAAVQES